MSKKMKRHFHLLVAVLLIVGLGISDLQVSAKALNKDFDVLIKGGTILDGSGLERYEADIAIKDGHIAEIGDLSDASAKDVVDAEGLFVSPGFIDVHSHAAVAALKEAKSSLTQGVTTEMMNPDGGGPTDVNQRFNLESDGLGINIGAYIGFNSVWKEVVGNEDRDATEEEIADMRELVQTAMEAGAGGVSSGLFYRPAYYADIDEVIDVVSEAKEWRTIFTNHQRNENNDVIEATEETIEIGERAGLIPEITHIKTQGPDNWGKSVDMLNLIEAANERGVYTVADIYPYLRSQTGLTAIVPPWVEDGGRDAMLDRFADPELRPQIEKEIEEIMYSRVEGPEGVYFPTKRRTLADYMEMGLDDTRNRSFLSILNLDYNTEFDVDIDQLKVTNSSGNTVYEYDFKGNDGDEWDSSKFNQTHSYPSGALTYTLEDNAGHVNLDPRIRGNGSAYGKIKPDMPDVGDSETTMRFKVGDTMGKNQLIRLWIDSDDFGSGSSFAMNGYGVAIRLDQDRIQIQERENGSTNLLDTIRDAGIEPGTWLDIKLKMEDDTFSVKMWPASEEEPEEWNRTIDVSKEEVIEDQKTMVSMTNRDADSQNAFYFDELKVTSNSGDDVYFDYGFEGANGDSWDNDKIKNIHAFPVDPPGATYSIQDNTGKVLLDKRDKDLCCSSYGKFMTNMDDVDDNDVLVKFRADNVDSDQQLRIFTEADKFLSGMAMPVNGFGMEFDLKNNEMNLIKREDSSTKELDSKEMELDTDWHMLRLRTSGDKVNARVWKDGEEEPEEWDVGYVEEERELTIGETTMQLLEQNGNLRSIYAFGHEDDFARFIQSPYVAIASDGGATTSDSVHPRRYGTQPRTLGKFVREEGLLGWEEAIQKMTSLPATIVGFSDRGYIAEGMKADITIFDPEKVKDNATFEDPKQYADGIVHVFVNGQLALTDGELTGVQAGEAIRLASNMPSRPLTKDEEIEIEENREIDPMDEEKEDGDSSIKFDLKQGAKDIKAEGTLEVVDENSSIELVSESFGRVQQYDGWKSFTGSGIVNDEKLTTFRVTIDENDPTVEGDRPVVTIDIVGEGQIKGFLGEEASDEVDKEELQEKVDEIVAADLDESQYTEESWENLTDALAKAEEVLADEEATQEQVDEALEQLIAAYEGLEGHLNKDALQKKIEEIEAADLDESQYTEESWEKLTNALTKAEEVLSDEDATQAEVDNALEQLNAAYQGLKGTLDKEPLQDKVDEIKAEDLDESQYTGESWDALQTAVRISEQLLKLNNDRLNQSIVDKSLSNLEIAREALEGK